jgi:hypothetical protein
MLFFSVARAWDPASSPVAVGAGSVIDAVLEAGMMIRAPRGPSDWIVTTPTGVRVLVIVDEVDGYDVVKHVAVMP